MKKLFTICFLLLRYTGLVYAQTDSSRLQITASGGYEQLNLKWSIAGNINGEKPNILSELRWKNVAGSVINGSLNWRLWKRVYAIAGYSRVFIKAGTVTDDDYNGDNRTNQIYHDLFNGNLGFARHWLAGAGYCLVNKGPLTLCPYIGYSENTQSLHILDRTGNSPDLNSTYETRWKGPFIKVLATYALYDKIQFNGIINYQQSVYSAKANWNFIQTFQHPVSYRHTANGYWLTAGLSCSYIFNHQLSFMIGAEQYYAKTGNGTDELFLITGPSQKTQLNNVSLNGYRIFGGLILKY
ncbi:hypothetical protein ACFQZX_08390 [Mucilaginibacter litoreus]|uniref:Protochlamydia outer membrane protein domain-containing protein n=1 Tax=Mucilaginibacter litoreus TaxID=1048221 RepID=A0ABW3ATH7_9SPHI